MIKMLLITIVVGGLSILVSVSHGERRNHQITVISSDFQYNDSSWTVSPGREVTMTFINQGAESHEWVLLKNGEDISLPFSEDDEGKIYWEIEADPGKTIQGTFTAPQQPGTYKVVCGKKTHLEKGMQALMVIR